MESAQYGRMRTGRCVSGSYGEVGCAVDVLAFLDKRCSGLQKCTVYVSDPVLHNMRPCPKDLSSFLEAEYSCEKVATGTFHSCHMDHELLATPASAGFLSSGPAIEQGHGTERCPWTLRARPGQTLKLSILHFLHGRWASSADIHRPADVCFEIGTIKDGSTSKTMSLCGGGPRERLLYNSKSHEISVELLRGEVLKGLPPFLIHYQVMGCDTITAPDGGVVTISGNTAVVRCNQSQETWYVTCSGTSWIGDIGNCSQGGLDQGSFISVKQEAEFPVGILAVVALGVALGVFFGGALLSLAAIYMKRRRRQYDRARSSKEGTQDYNGMSLNTVLTTDSSKLYSDCPSPPPPIHQACLMKECPASPSSQPSIHPELLGLVYTDHMIHSDGTRDSKLYAVGCGGRPMAYVQQDTTNTAPSSYHTCPRTQAQHHYELTHCDYPLNQ